MRLAQEAVDVREVMRRRPHEVDVERLVGKREMRRISEDPVRVDDVALGRDPARLVEHLAGEVQANYTAHKGREREGRVAGAGGDVEGEVTGFRLREVEHLLQPRRRRVEGRSRIPAGDIAKAVANVR